MAIGKLLLSNGRAHGWRPDKPDLATAPKLSDALGSLTRSSPKNPSLKPEFFPRIRDQKKLGSCTGHGTRSAVAYKMYQHFPDKLGGEWGKNTWDLSTLAMYWLGRREENSLMSDSGCEIKDVIRAAQQYGIPTEEAWPYIVSKFAQQPPAKALKTGLWHKVSPKSYRCDEDGSRTKTMDRILQALAAGLPVVYGFMCYSNLSDDGDTGIVPLPAGGAEGGHCVAAFWADTASRILWGPNSWGSKDYGGHAPAGAMHHERGYIGLPFQYVLDGLADDAHAIDLDMPTAR